MELAHSLFYYENLTSNLVEEVAVETCLCNVPTQIADFFFFGSFPRYSLVNRSKVVFMNELNLTVDIWNSIFMIEGVSGMKGWCWTIASHYQKKKILE